jgi:hypothetical protein
MAMFVALSRRITPERCRKAPDIEGCGAVVSTPQQVTPKQWPQIPPPRAERKEGALRFTFKLTNQPFGESTPQINLKKPNSPQAARRCGSAATGFAK